MDGEVSPGFVEEFRRANSIATTAAAAARVVDEVRRQVLCLLERSAGRYVYTDMKMENVFYRRERGAPTGFAIRLGDLGSMVPARGGALERDDGGETYYTFTYPCLPSGQANRQFFGEPEKARCLAFQLGLLLAALLGIDIGAFRHENVHVRSSVRLPKRRDDADGGLYSREEFREFYGGTDEWDAAAGTQRLVPTTRDALGDDRLWRALGGDSDTKTVGLVAALRRALRPAGLGGLADLVNDDPSARPPITRSFLSRPPRPSVVGVA